MSTFDVGELADLLVGKKPDKPRSVEKPDSDLIQGTVVSYQSATNTYTVTLQGDTSNVTGVSSCVPLAAGDTIWLLRKGLMVLAITHKDNGWIRVGSGGSAPGFTGSWVDYDTVPSYPVRFKKVNGIVHLEGVMKNGVITSTAFTLPVGYRPEYEQIVACTANNAFGSYRIAPSGGVVPYAGGNAWFSLAGATFTAYQ